jgi:hypothetical protein
VIGTSLLDSRRASSCGDGLLLQNTHAVYSSACCSNNVDVIVFSVYEHGYKQCSDEPMGTYISPVPNFVEGYLGYHMQSMQDKGYDDYETPDVAQYTECTRIVIQNEEYWLRLGCADGNTQSLSVNIYSDNTCTQKSEVDGYDDSNIDASGISVRTPKVSIRNYRPWLRSILLLFAYHSL